jgi:hypothetical protein
MTCDLWTTGTVTSPRAVAHPAKVFLALPLSITQERENQPQVGHTCTRVLGGTISATRKEGQ